MLTSYHLKCHLKHTPSGLAFKLLFTPCCTIECIYSFIQQTCIENLLRAKH